MVVQIKLIMKCCLRGICGVYKTVHSVCLCPTLPTAIWLKCCVSSSGLVAIVCGVKYFQSASGGWGLRTLVSQKAVC